MYQRYCKLCRQSKCVQGMHLEIPGQKLRQIWVCKSCLLGSQNPIISYNVNKGKVDIEEIRQDSVLPCPVCCSDNPPKTCNAPKKRLSSTRGVSSSGHGGSTGSGKNSAGGHHRRELEVFFCSAPCETSRTPAPTERG